MTKWNQDIKQLQTEKKAFEKECELAQEQIFGFIQEKSKNVLKYAETPSASAVLMVNRDRGKQNCCGRNSR